MLVLLPKSFARPEIKLKIESADFLHTKFLLYNSFHFLLEQCPCPMLTFSFMCSPFFPFENASHFKSAKNRMRVWQIGLQLSLSISSLCKLYYILMDTIELISFLFTIYLVPYLIECDVVVKMSFDKVLKVTTMFPTFHRRRYWSV